MFFNIKVYSNPQSPCDESKSTLHLHCTLSIYAAKLKTTLLKTSALRAVNDFQQAVNGLTVLQLIGLWIITI